MIKKKKKDKTMRKKYSKIKKKNLDKKIKKNKGIAIFVRLELFFKNSIRK